MFIISCTNAPTPPIISAVSLALVPSREDGGTTANPRRRTLVFTNQNYSLVAVYFWERLSNSLRECDSQAKPQLLQHYFYRSNSLCHSGLIQLHNSFVKCLSRSLPFGSGTNSPKQTNFQSRCFHMCSQQPCITAANKPPFSSSDNKS